MKLLVMAIVVLLQGALASESILNGNWGRLSLTYNNKWCLASRYNSHSSRQRDEVWLSSCSVHYQVPSRLLWRYDTKTKQLQNKGLTEEKGEPYCLVQEAGTCRTVLRVLPCLGNAHYKLNTRYEHQGRSVQFVSELDSRNCIDGYGWANYERERHTQLYTCESITRTNTDQWFNFNMNSRYHGGQLRPPVEPSIRDGNWGHFRVRRTGSCWAYDITTNIIEQRHCLENDDAQVFRYVPETHQIRSLKYDKYHGKVGLGCLVVDRTRIYVRGCTGSVYERFHLEDGYAFDGRFQQVRAGDGRCVYVSGAYAGHRRIYTGTCRDVNYRSETQWIDFRFRRHSKQCGKGQYLSDGKCRPCPAGTFNNVHGGNVCKTCPTGTTSPAGATSCRRVNNCPAGTFQNTRGICESCPRNTFSASKGSYTCKKCPAGYHTKGEGSVKCTRNMECRPGTFINGNTCTLCPMNTFSNTPNSPTCRKCPKNHFTLKAGSVKCIKRTYCKAGKFHNGHHCQDCPRDTYSNEVGNVRCTPCPDGFETKGTGATFCTRKNDCQPGSYFNAVSNKCQLCPRNTYTDKAHQTSCVKCPAGTGTKAEGGKQCVKINYCQPGKFHNGKMCVGCPLNTFSNEVGAWECKPCPAGTKTDGKGSRWCRKIKPDDCTPGKFYNGKWCEMCKKDTYTDIKGMKYCKKCPSGYETKSTGSCSCVKKPSLKVIAEADSNSVRCYQYVSKPACLLKCRFKTTSGQVIQNKSSISFYKLQGSRWRKLNLPVMFNNKSKWFSVKVAQVIKPSDGGAYKCEGKYGSAVGSANMELHTLSKGE